MLESRLKNSWWHACYPGYYALSPDETATYQDTASYLAALYQSPEIIVSKTPADRPPLLRDCCYLFRRLDDGYNSFRMSFPIKAAIQKLIQVTWLCFEKGDDR